MITSYKWYMMLEQLIVPAFMPRQLLLIILILGPVNIFVISEGVWDHFWMRYWRIMDIELKELTLIFLMSLKIQSKIFIHLSVCLSIHPSIYPFIHPSIHLFVPPSVCSSIHFVLSYSLCRYYIKSMNIEDHISVIAGNFSDKLPNFE